MAQMAQISNFFPTFFQLFSNFFPTFFQLFPTFSNFTVYCPFLIKLPTPKKATYKSTLGDDESATVKSEILGKSDLSAVLNIFDI